MFAGVTLAVLLAGCGTTEDRVPEVQTLTLTEVSPATGDATTLVTVTGEYIAADASVLVCGKQGSNLVVRDGVDGQSSGMAAIDFYPAELPSDAICDVVVTQGEDDTAEAAILKNAFVFDFKALTLTGSSPGTGDADTTVTVVGKNIAGNATVTVCHEPVTNLEIFDEAGDVVDGTAKTGVEIRFNPPVDPAGAPSCDIVVNQGLGDTFETEFLDEVFVYDSQ